MSKKYHVLMVLESGYPSYGGGGAEFQIQTICNNLPKHIEATIIVPKVLHAPQSTHDTVDGINVYRIPYPRIRVLGGILMLVSLFFYLFKNRKKFDAIHAHIANNMAAACCLFGKLFNKPVVVKLTGWLELAKGILVDGGGSPRIAIIKKAMHCATAFQATSQEISERLIEKGYKKSKIHLIPNAVDIQRFTPSHPKQYYRDALAIKASFVIVYIGRLVEEKSLDTLLNAWSLAFRNDQSNHLLLVGDGHLREDLESLSKDLEIEKEVTFVGPSSKVEDYLFAADLGILPSTHEGLSNTLLEYMASGLAVIGTKISGTEDLVKPGKTGWLFKPKDENTLSQILLEAKKLQSSKLIDFGHAGKEFVTHFASVDSTIRKFNKLYGFENY